MGLKCALYFKMKACLRKSYLLGNVNQRRSSKQSKGVQSDNDHLGGGVGCHQLLQQLPGAGGQAGIVVHVLQNGDQLQLQVHRCGQTCNKERNTATVSPWAGFLFGSCKAQSVSGLLPLLKGDCANTCSGFK